MTSQDEQIHEENRKIRYLRFLVDFSILSILQGGLSPGQALGAMEQARRAASALFPGKEATFDLIYGPRFRRAIRESFGEDPDLSGPGRSSP